MIIINDIERMSTRGRIGEVISENLSYLLKTNRYVLVDENKQETYLYLGLS